jgi:hypothetical protein
MALHYSKDLEKYSFFIEIENKTKEQSISKRLYFNKQILPFGFLEISLNDIIKVSFKLLRNN